MKKIDNLKIQKDSTFSVKVIPRAEKNEIVGFMEDGTVKIRLTAPPVEGKANEALIRFLSDILGTPTQAINVVSGKTSRKKLVAVKGMTFMKIHELVNEVIHKENLISEK